MKVTERIRDTLIEKNVQNAEFYRSRASNYLTKLKSMHNEMQILSAQIPIKRRILVTTHDAFGYLGKAYGFEVQRTNGYKYRR